MKEINVNSKSQELVKNEVEMTLVIGATGKTGRRIVDRLVRRGVPVREGSRSGSPKFDWNDRSTWNAALKNVTSLFISYYPDLAVPGAPDDIQALTHLAAQSGVKKVVLLSGRGEEDAQRCEEIVQRSGLDWTIVRCSWFNQNFSENFLRDMIMSGVVTLPVEDVREPFIDVNDIADVAVAALTDAKHSNQLYELTGPELITFADAIQEISKATGREIHYQPITREEFMTGMTSQGLPDPFVQLVDYLFTTVLDGRNAYTCDGVQRALGREPKRFADYSRELTFAL